MRKNVENNGDQGFHVKVVLKVKKSYENVETNNGDQGFHVKVVMRDEIENVRY